jgi:hypothetical protein
LLENNPEADALFNEVSVLKLKEQDSYLVLIFLFLPLPIFYILFPQLAKRKIQLYVKYDEGFQSTRKAWSLLKEVLQLMKPAIGRILLVRASRSVYVL